MKTGRTLQELAEELDRQNTAKRDLLVDTGALHMYEASENDFNRVSLRVGAAGNYEQFDINDVAHGQIGSHLKIPAAYYNRMREEMPSLLAENVNSWFFKKPDTRRMLRTLDGTARAFLSSRYRCIDNYEIAQTVLPIIGNMPGAKIQSCELTDSKMYLKVVDPRLETEIVKGDAVQAGVIISNSEVGHGSVSVHPLLFRLICSNGMIAADEGLRKYHVGRINESGDSDYEIYRDATIEADDRAFLMKLEDTVNAAVNEAQFLKIVDRLRDSTQAKIDPIHVPQVVELAAKEFNITQNEGKGILGHLIEGGELSLYGLGNAVTRHAKDVESYDRSTELEHVGFKIITMAPHLWKRINAQVAS